MEFAGGRGCKIGVKGVIVDLNIKEKEAKITMTFMILYVWQYNKGRRPLFLGYLGCSGFILNYFISSRHEPLG